MQILTIGASTQTMADLVHLLQAHSVTAVADVRSIPASRYTPQFNRAPLRTGLSLAGIRYVFLGNELGARSSNPDCYIDGKVQYWRLAKTPEFQDGVRRLIDGAARERIAVLCTEQEALDCHRTILIAPVLVERGLKVSHIHRDGRLESHADAMRRLRAMFGLDQPSLFETEDELVARALALQAARIAYVDEEVRIR